MASNIFIKDLPKQEYSGQLCMSCSEVYVDYQIVFTPHKYFSTFELCSNCLKELGEMICDLQTSQNQRQE